MQPAVRLLDLHRATFGQPQVAVSRDHFGAKKFFRLTGVKSELNWHAFL